MTNKEYLKKIITFVDGKLLCDGIEISIEEAEKIIQIQSKAMEEEVYDYIQKNPNLEREEIAELSDTVIGTNMRVAHAKIDVKDLDEYENVRKDIQKALEICDRALKIFAFKSKKVDKSNDKDKINIIWKNQPIDNPNYDPTIEEMIETSYDIILKELIFKEFEKQFATTDIDLKREEIEIYGNFTDEFLIYIYHKDLEIYFQINDNQGQFEGLKGNYIGSGLRINSMLIQTSLDSYSNKSGHTIKTAFSFDNIITMQVRFLKNSIKQEINYSLSKSISKAQERYFIASFFMNTFKLLMDRKTKRRLKNIISDSLLILEKKNNKDNDDIEESDDLKPDLIKETDKKISNETYIKNQITKVFGIKEDQIKLEKKENKKDQLFDIQVSGQKIIISYLDSGVMFISSSNTLGTGKNDIQNLEVKGSDFFEKSEKAILASYVPVLNRQIENTFINVKGKKNKNIAQLLEAKLKEIVYSMIENKLSSKELKNKIDDIINDLLKIDSINYATIFEIIDKVFYNHFINFFKNEKIYIHDKEFLADKLFSESNATFYKYKNSEELGDSFVERLENVEKYIRRLFYLTKTIKLIQDYKDLKFASEISDNTKDQIQISIEKENELRKIGDELSEDNILGVTSRKLLSLMDISISSKDEMFKFNLDEILSEFTQANL